MQREYLIFVLGFYCGNGCDNSKGHYVGYRLLNRGVHDLRVGCDLFELGNCLWKLVCVCEPRVGVKARGSDSSSSYIPLKERKRISWLSSSDIINEILCKVKLIQEVFL